MHSNNDKEAGVFMSTVFAQLCALGYMVSTWQGYEHISPDKHYGWVRQHEWFLKVISSRLDVGEEKPLRVGIVQSQRLYESNSYVVISYYGEGKVTVHQQDRCEEGWTRAYIAASTSDTLGLASGIIRMTTELIEVVEGVYK